MTNQNSKGEKTKAFYVKQLEESIWGDMERLKNLYQLKSNADLLRFIVKKAIGRI